MNAIVKISCIFLLIYHSNVQLQPHTTSLEFSALDLLDDTVLNNTESTKSALRYGFHRTSECDNYEKAFLCIQKCVDKGYDVAYSDKHCFCTCYVKKEKAKYTIAANTNRSRWKLGTPKTTKPAWIQKLEDKKNKTTTESIKLTTKPIVQQTEIGTDSSDVTITSPQNDTGVPDAANKTDTTDTQNVTVSDNTTNINDSKITNKTDSSIAGDATNTTIAANKTDISDTVNTTSSASKNATDTGSATNATDTASAPNATDTASAANATDTTSTTNATDTASATKATDTSGATNVTDTGSIANKTDIGANKTDSGSGGANSTVNDSKNATNANTTSNAGA